ncbi:uncharacterized protein [Amphiura filiformis]|uniref:uncharacterized protein n=1 Tax=Amphiura filiformis TaxID=82378 RepID=UPI003B21285A
MNTSKHHRKTQAIMARRTVKVVPVGAWVELGAGIDIRHHDAIISAHEEEERIQERQLQKQAKLERFQRDVRQRVQRLQQQKRKQQLQESFQAVELERNVIQQSSRAAEQATSKRNHCLYRNKDLSIKQQEDAFSSDAESEKEEKNAEHMRDHSHQIFQMVRSAKHNLAAKQLIPEKTMVPGGQWGASFTRDKQTQDTTTSQDHTGASWKSNSRIPQQPIDDIGSYGDSEDPARQLHTTESILQTGGMSPPKTITINPNLGAHESRHSYPINHECEEGSTSGRVDDGSGDRIKVVTFNPVDDVVSGEHLVKKSVRQRPLSHVPKQRTVPDVMPGVQEEEHKRQIKNQYSMYRRLFMDIEREQVRENIRKKAHQKKINSLKKQKEQERQEVESTVSHAMEARHPLTGETELEAHEKEQQEERYIEEMVVKQKQQQQKNKETQRYIKALRAMMREKMEKQRITMPPLCACGPTIWDSNPDTCANNCIFYKNPKAYAKALSSLLMSCQVD